MCYNEVITACSFPADGGKPAEQEKYHPVGETEYIMALGKMRVLWLSGKGKMIGLCEEIMKQYDLKGEPIPPAYNCENEKLVFIGISAGKAAPDMLRRFLRELNKTRAQNVAFLMDAPKPVADMLMQQCIDAGTHVMDEVFYYNPGFSLPFMKGISAEDKEKVLAWAKKCVAEVHQ